MRIGRGSELQQTTPEIGDSVSRCAVMCPGSLVREGVDGDVEKKIQGGLEHVHVVMSHDLPAIIDNQSDYNGYMSRG